MPVPALIRPPVPLITPEIVVFPVPSIVRLNPPLATVPLTVKRLLELLTQLWAAPSANLQLIVSVNALALSRRMPRFGVPLIVLPAKVMVLVAPEMLKFCPILPVIQIPPMVVFVPTTG